MFALLAEARQLSNPELAERVGFRLDGKERRKLNDLKLVESGKVGRVYVHELSDAGWRWCADELTARPSGHGGSMERALYVVLGGLDRYLRCCGQSLADVFRQRQDTGAEARIEAGYQALTSGRSARAAGQRGQGHGPGEAGKGGADRGAPVFRPWRQQRP